MPARPRPVARRTTLAGALTSLGIVTGCDLDLRGNDASSGGPGTPQHPDAALVDDVLKELTRSFGLVAATEATYPRLQVPMARLRALHETHAATLGDMIGPGFAHGGRFPDAARALTAVRAQERRTQARLADSSVAAESGDLARLLASMSAAVGQALTELPTSLPTASVPR